MAKTVQSAKRGRSLSAIILLVETVRALMMLRDEFQARKDSLSGALKRGEGALPLSSDAIVTLTSQHLVCKNASRLPVLVVAAAYEAARGCYDKCRYGKCCHDNCRAKARLLEKHPCWCMIACFFAATVDAVDSGIEHPVGECR